MDIRYRILRRIGSQSAPWIRSGKSGSPRQQRRRTDLEELESRHLLSGVTEFPVTNDQLPTDITAGPDGNIWFTEAMGTEIGMFNPTTDVVTQFALPIKAAGADSSAIAVGPDGNIWFTDYNANAIGTVNLTTDAVSEFPIPTANAGPWDITLGSDGNLWFTETQANQIGMINPTTDAITEFSVPTASASLGDITAGPDGNLWFTEQAGNAIGMINPTTDAITEYPIPTQDSMPMGIAAGPDGNIWFTAYNAIGTINPTTDAITEIPVPVSAAGNIILDGELTAGPDGNVWFCNLLGDAVGMINPTTDAITQFWVPVAQTGLAFAGGPSGIAAGPDGNIWIALENADQIGVFNPQTINDAVTTQPVLPRDPQTSPVTSLPPIASPPAPPAGAGVPSGFADPLPASLGQTSTGSRGTITVGLSSHPDGATVTVSTENGVDTFSELTVRKLGDRTAYELPRTRELTPTSRNQGAVPSARTVRIATERILTAGRGKGKHVVGFKIALSRASIRRSPGTQSGGRPFKPRGSPARQ